MCVYIYILYTHLYTLIHTLYTHTVLSQYVASCYICQSFVTIPQFQSQYLASHPSVLHADTYSMKPRSDILWWHACVRGFCVSQEWEFTGRAGSFSCVCVDHVCMWVSCESLVCFVSVLHTLGMSPVGASFVVVYSALAEAARVRTKFIHFINPSQMKGTFVVGCSSALQHGDFFFVYLVFWSFNSIKPLFLFCMDSILITMTS